MIIHPLNKKTAILLAVMAVALIAAGTYLIISRQASQPPTNGGQEQVRLPLDGKQASLDASHVAQASSSLPNARPTNEDIAANESLYIDIMADSDQDGLPNDKEQAYGTDPKKPDSDNDGLTDMAEVISFFTDPLVADTDKDGFSDGDEAKAGFNPCGEGKLSASSTCAIIRK